MFFVYLFSKWQCFLFVYKLRFAQMVDNVSDRVEYIVEKKKK